jgi:large subunit ribosomal protein L18
MKTSLANQQKARRIARVRATISGTTERPRLAVFRSLAHISAQVIDDTSGKTLAAARDVELSDADRKGKKLEVAHALGKLLGTRALEKGVKAVVFDRRDKKYHGRVRALAEGARAAGLTF